MFQGRLYSPLDTDGLARHYAARADDERATGPVREGAMLFAAAEGRLDGDEDHEQALTAVEQALAHFKSAKDATAVADATRLIVACHRAKAHALYNACDDAGAKEALDAATQKAHDEVAAAQGAGDKYLEACMLLAGAECLLDVRSGGVVEAYGAAEKKATEARAIFKESGNAKMEGLACLALAAAHYEAQAAQGAADASGAALGLLKGVEDARGTARALRAQAQAISVGATTGAALERGRQAVDRAVEIYRALGLKRAEAAELSFAARWCLFMGRPRDALPPAAAAAAAFKELGYGRGWLAESRGLVVKALMGAHDWKRAMRAAGEDADDFRRSPDDKQFLPAALESLVQCHLEAQLQNRAVDTIEAQRAAEELHAVSQDLGSKRWQAIACHNLAQLSAKDKSYEKAEQLLAQAMELCDEAGLAYEKGFILNTSIEVYIDQDKADKAKDVASDARKLFQGLSKTSEEGFVVQILAQCYLLSDVESAMNLAMESQELFRGIGNKKAEASSWDLVAKIQGSAGAVREAERSLRTAAALYQQSGDKSAQAYALQATAAEFGHQKRFDDALLAAQEALAMARAARDSKAEVEMLVLVSQAVLGQTYSRSEAAAAKGLDSSVLWHVHEAKMLRPAREAVCLARKHGDDYHTGGAIFAVAQIHMFAGRHEAARNAAREVEEKWSQIENPGGVAYVKLLQAELAFATGRAKDAHDLASEALATFEQLGDKAGMDQALAHLEKFKSGPAQLTNEVPSGMAAIEGSSTAVEARPMKTGMDLEIAKKLCLETAMAAIGDTDAVDMDSPLMDIGLDSLAAIAFRESLMTASGLTVPASVIFDFPSLTALADHLVETSLQ